MKKQIVIFAVGVVLLAVGYVAQSWTLAECRKPSINTKECYNPDNRISSCSELLYNHCSLSNEQAAVYAVFEIENFPDGTEESDSGVTMEKGEKCWRFAMCYWKGDPITGRCNQSNIWTPWRLKSKTKNNPDEICPQS